MCQEISCACKTFLQMCQNESRGANRQLVCATKRQSVPKSKLVCEKGGGKQVRSENQFCGAFVKCQKKNCVCQNVLVCQSTRSRRLRAASRRVVAAARSEDDVLRRVRSSFVNDAKAKTQSQTNEHTTTHSAKTKSHALFPSFRFALPRASATKDD